MDIGNLHDIRAIILDATDAPKLQHPDDIDFGGDGVQCLGVVGLRRCECTSSMWRGSQTYEYPDLVAEALPAELVGALLAEYSSSRIASAAWLRQLYTLPDTRD